MGSLRWEPPQQDTVRFAKKDVEIQSVKISEGAPIKVILASANRNREVYINPETFNPLRDKKEILSFGLGSHSCLGKTLAISQLELAFSQFIEAFPYLTSQNSSLLPPIAGYSFRKPKNLKVNLF